MNRLILVGNGFDLAHGLKTSYKNFIDNFWKVQYELYIKDGQKSIEYKNSFFRLIYNLVYDHQTNKDSEFGKFSKQVLSKRCGFQFFNKFLEKISNRISIQNWVDIENEYYNELKKVSDTGYSVDELNKDFEEVKKLLIDYLVKINKNFNINNQVSKHITNDYNLKDIESKHHIESIRKIQEKCESLISLYNSKLKENSKNIYHLINNETDTLIDKNNLDNEKFENLSNNETEVMFFNINKTLFLNFNYTNTTLEYIDEFNKINGNYEDYNISEIHIHGELNNPENPIIFGFGDDVDKKYQEFEDLNDNRYLENFKSIAYLQTDNYKKLLEFIDSEEYQVFIFGHSCGISDRTMLNTIFEHDNCKSIKPFYHRKKDDKGNYIVDDFGNFIDNYTEIVQNISRNFNDKKKYRDRVVNKTYCEPLT